ncbi:MAG TPA: fatty acid CoA ligase family protein [Oscillatoriaceae cyanobacterium]
MPTTLEPVNIARRFAETAAALPEKAAVIQGDRRVSFAELSALTERYAGGLAAIGIEKGMRCVLMVPPGIEFFALTFALFRLGAVPVMVDPGMGVRNLGVCLQEARPEAFIGVPKAHVARVVLGWSKPTIRINVTVGRKLFWGGHTLSNLPEQRLAAIAETEREDVAAILFTSGSTGVPKGAVYTHGVFDAQVRVLRDHYRVGPEDVDVPTFPLFALFDAALGATAVIPEMDFTRPAEVAPLNILNAAQANGATMMFGSPALLNVVGRYADKYNIKLARMRHVFSAGAPVPPNVLERFARMLPEGARIHTPYGATEALPVCSIAHDEILTDVAARWAQGEGTCVGRPVGQVTVEIIRISDEPIAEWSDELRVPDGEVGEITVRGAVVTQAYYNRPESDALAKMADGRGGVWHRMGDLGWRDAEGRIWFVGRKNQRVETEKGRLYTIQVEAVFNQHPKVFRSALVGIGTRRCIPRKPVLIVELEPGETATPALEQELREIAWAYSHTREIDTFLVHPKFPVDIRHNAKIFREKLAFWAAERLGMV